MGVLTQLSENDLAECLPVGGLKGKNGDYCITAAEQQPGVLMIVPKDAGSRKDCGLPVKG